MKDYSEIKELLLKFSFLGIENSKSTGAMLIGRAPHIAESAWLNRLYSPIDKNEIIKMEDGISKKIPTSYVDFLTNFSNGLNILGDTLCLFGYRSNYVRTVDFSWQPYSLISFNKYDKPRNSTGEMLFIGSYDWDGSLLYMTTDEKVHFCNRDDSTSLFIWDSLSSMLISELKRLYNIFDSSGIQIDDTQATTPI